MKYLRGSWDRYGVEINDVAAKRAEKRGVRIIAKDFSEIDNLSIQFDAVTAFDVIEHVEDPKAFVGKIIKVTRPGGVIIISSGNTDAISWRFMRSQYWRHCKKPILGQFVTQFSFRKRH